MGNISKVFTLAGAFAGLGSGQVLQQGLQNYWNDRLTAEERENIEAAFQERFPELLEGLGEAETETAFSLRLQAKLDALSEEDKETVKNYLKEILDKNELWNR